MSSSCIPRFIIATFVVTASHQIGADITQIQKSGIDAATAEALVSMRIAGLSIAVIKDNTLVFSKGFGLAKISA